MTIFYQTESKKRNMDRFDYTYIFSDIRSVSTCLKVIDYRSSKTSKIGVFVNDYQLLRRDCVLAEIADLIDLAVAVHVADRLSIRKGEIPCHIHIVLPLRYPRNIDHPHIMQCLVDTLYWYTGDHWCFEFKQRIALGRPAELQACLPWMNTSFEPTEVALWSGGLDSLAGLFTRLSADTATHYTLIGTGSNSIIQHTQSQVAQVVREIVPNRTKLVQLPICLEETADLPKNSSQRSRGFVFLLLGAATSLIEKQDTLYVYENGIGAINLPFRMSEVGLDHARSVHPRSLLKMSTLVSQLLDMPFKFRNPFLFWTKAQMCEALVQDNTVDLIFDTISCDRLHREKPMQCGYCSSCLLRRQALAVLGVEDKTPYVATHGTRPRTLDSSHLRAMLYQVDKLRVVLNAPEPWQAFSARYYQVTELYQTTQYDGTTPEQRRNQLLQLYERYVKEWDVVQDTVGRELLDDEVHVPLRSTTTGYQQEQLAWK